MIHHKFNISIKKKLEINSKSTIALKKIPQIRYHKRINKYRYLESF